ncbi:unannotated protein [freshwater metagenome]|uniref:Unannotated protein n=1 Tax=freshwater metagenome TaxID=449393 RepID=A0A6J7ITM0_9ZZZZ|nr:fluoride efflux transporter CrcB [Actinomycetota bacterium]
MRADPRELAAVFAGGALGAIARARLGEAFAHDPGSWSWATLIANLTGAFLLGLVVAHAQHHPRPLRHARPLLGTGLCGALTTFSAMQLEVLQMLDTGAVALAAGYLAALLAGGLGAIALADLLERRGPLHG